MKQLEATHDIAIKLNRANALLYTIRNFVNRNIVRNIYFAIFEGELFASH